VKRLILALSALTLSSPALAQSAPLILKSGRIAQAGPADRITLTGNGKFFAQDGAAIHRINDRLFVGAATTNDGAFPNVTKDWLATLQVSWGATIGYTAFSMLNALTNNDPGTGSGILGGAQTLHLQPTGAAVGVEGFAIANQASATAKAYALYGEGHRTSSSAGDAYGIEVDPVAHVASVTPTPNLQGNTIGVQVASGGAYSGFTQQNTSAAIQLAANGSSFITGLNVIRGSIVGTNPAIQLPTGNGLTFTDAANHTGGIAATFSASNSATLTFTDSALKVTGAPVQLPSYTVGTLPTCVAGLAGAMAYVTDAAAPTYNAALTGGGAIGVPVACNGTSWTSH
jgi:hypothetical protein